MKFKDFIGDLALLTTSISGIALSFLITSSIVGYVVVVIAGLCLSAYIIRKERRHLKQIKEGNDGN